MQKQKDQHKSIHQHVEQLLRHKVSLALVLGLMGFAVLSFDIRFRGFMQEAYAQGWSWVGMYMHHEHPAHSHAMFGLTRAARISGPNS